MSDAMGCPQQGPAIERKPEPVTIINLAKRNSYRRVERVCDRFLANGELADYDDELANSVKIAGEIAAGVVSLSDQAKRARQYAEQLEAHMDEGGKFAQNNVRDLIQFIKEIA